jgi:hypothetical protein
MAERKVILFNLSKGRLGTSESQAFGTLVLSLVQSIALRRERLPPNHRPMTHVLVDECQNFVTSEIKTIIRETRKFGTPITLAQQEIGGEMAPDLAKVVTRTTNVKIAGRSALAETRSSGQLVGVEPQEMIDLANGHFYFKNGTAPAFLLRVRSDRLGAKGGVSAHIWAQIKKQQMATFYRGQLTKPRQAAEPQEQLKKTDELADLSVFFDDDDKPSKPAPKPKRKPQTPKSTAKSKPAAKSNPDPNDSGSTSAVKGRKRRKPRRYDFD